MRYEGQITLFPVVEASTHEVSGWAECAGQELAVAGNEALYSIIRNTFGGQPVTTFRLPQIAAPTSDTVWMICVLGSYPIHSTDGPL